MPKRVDHDERRTEILKSFFAFATSTGLANVTLRGVADHAGVSLRQVQYYFGTKDALVQAGLDLLASESTDRVNKKLSELSDSNSAHSTLVTLFEVALPVDTKSRQFHLLWMSYAMLSVTSPFIANSPLLDGTNQLQIKLTEIISDGIKREEFRSYINPEVEALILLGLINGLGTSVLLGQQTARAAREAFQHQVDGFL